jgi:hypothetical protein
LSNKGCCFSSFFPFLGLKNSPQDFKALEILSTKTIKVSLHASSIMNNKTHQNEGGLDCMFSL